MKYYLLSILTRCGEFEFTQEITIKVEENVKVENAANEVVANWYEYDSDGPAELDPDGVAWFDNGNAVCCAKITEISKKEYGVFKKYGI